MQPSVSIIVLNWDGLDDTIECLESLQRITYPSYEVTVVDNGSEGDDVEVLKDRFGDSIHLIENDSNYGIAQGRNIGITDALRRGTDYVFLLDNDTIVDPHFLTQLVRVAESDDAIGLVNPMIYDYAAPQNLCFARGSRPSLLLGTLTEIEEQEPDERIVQSDFARGGCLLIQTEVLKSVGLLPAGYSPWGWEDYEYSIGAQRQGIRIAWARQSKIWHKGGRSWVDRGVLARIHHELGWWRGHHLIRRRCLSTPSFILSELFVVPVALVRYVTRPIVRRTTRAFKRLRGFIPQVRSIHNP